MLPAAGRPRFGYLPKDALRLIDLLKTQKSVFVLPAELLMRCGLRLHEVAGLQGSHIDTENCIVHVIQGKGGLNGDVPISKELVEKFNLSEKYLFRPAESWKYSFDRALRPAPGGARLGDHDLGHPSPALQLL